jgi:hypothetical protein
MTSCGMLRSVALVITEVSEELRASIIRVTGIGELGTLDVTSNRRTLRRNASAVKTSSLTNQNMILYFKNLEPELQRQLLHFVIQFFPIFTIEFSNCVKTYTMTRRRGLSNALL